MKLLKKIMVATDFSQHSGDALRMATLLAKGFHSEIALIHVMPEITGLKIDRDEIRKIGTGKLRELKADMERKGVPVAEAILRFGTPFERIVEYSDDLDVNLIVVGSGKRGKKYPLGTTAERVMLYADKPVLTVKQGGRPLIRKIVCPVDFSETSRRALENAIHLSKTFQAHLTVLTVFEPLLSSYFGIGQTPGESKEKALVKRQQQQLERFLRGLNFENLLWNKTILRGKPHQEILHAVHEAKPDLLVMGSMGKTGLTRMIMGSTTEKVVREMPCSVITLKQEHVFRFRLEKEVADIEKHFSRGKELLREQLTEGALARFEYCIRRDPLYVPAWESMVAAYRQIGEEKKAKRCEEMAEYIRKHLWENENGQQKS